MTAYLLGEICNEAGLPKGVLNIVHGLGTTTGQAIVEHPDIKPLVLLEVQQQEHILQELLHQCLKNYL